MLGTHDIALFIVAGLLLNITPGADTLYIVTRSVSQGSRAGALAALGVGLGCCVHTLAAALGLSALLATSATLFTTVKWVGAVYLFYLGITLIRKSFVSNQEPVALPVNQGTSGRIFLQGFLTNVLNPKVALFFLAFVPQFIAPQALHKTAAFLFLGALFNVNGTIWNLVLARMAARFSNRMASQSALSVWLNRTIGGLFLSLGLKLALSRNS